MAENRIPDSLPEGFGEKQTMNIQIGGDPETGQVMLQFGESKPIVMPIAHALLFSHNVQKKCLEVLFYRPPPEEDNNKGGPQLFVP